MTRSLLSRGAVGAGLVLVAALLTGCGGASTDTDTDIGSDAAGSPTASTSVASTPTASADGTTPKAGKMIALTFDDGPSPELTPRVLDLLDEHDIKATFFLQGSHVAKHPDLAREVAERGHVVGNHSWSHPDFTTIGAGEADHEITRTNEAIAKAAGVEPLLFRYPHGKESEAGNTIIRREEMWGGVLWHWSTRDKGDFACPGAEGVARYIAGNATDQGLILLHDGNDVLKCDPSQLDGIGSAITELKQQGWAFGVVKDAMGPSAVNQHSWVEVVAPESLSK